MRTIAIRCPRCRHEQSLRIRDLDAVHACERCKAHFTVDANGRCVVLGKSSTSQVSGRHAAPSGRYPAQSSARLPTVPDRPTSDLVDRWRAMPRLLKLGMLGAAIVLGALLLAPRLLPSPAAAIPEGLEDRADYAVDAFLSGRLDALLAIAEPASAPSLERWYAQKRPRWWGPDVSERTTFSNQVLFKIPSARTAGTLATISFDPDGDLAGSEPAASAPPPAKAKPPTRAPRGKLEVVLIWRLAENGLWIIDGGKTIKEATGR
jgi:hypothetical protein